MLELDFSSLLESISGWVTELGFVASAAACLDELAPCSEEDLEASTNGIFSLTGEAGSGALPGSSTEEAVRGGAPLKPRAMSSKVRPLVSGTLKYVKMKKMMRKIMNIMKTYGPHSSYNSQTRRKKLILTLCTHLIIKYEIKMYYIRLLQNTTSYCILLNLMYFINI